MTVTILHGDCRDVLKTLPAAAVQCCVTSPPYFGLRDYGVDGQIGLEQSSEAYIAELVAVFREVRRVLRDDGVLFLNLGDSYVSNGRYDAAYEAKVRRGGIHANDVNKYATYNPRPAAKASGLKVKDLIGIPWMAAFALRADGWWLRRDIIWAKPNPMPESVTDRPTSSHEYVFLLTKSARYYWDAEAVREPNSENPITIARNGRADKGVVGAADLHGTGWGQSGNGGYDRAAKAPKKTKVPGGWDTGAGAHGTIHRAGRTSAEYVDTEIATGRNCRSVWTIATSPLPEAHFATFPPALAERCILAGSRPGDTILDPFGGAGTVGLVADRLRRNALLIELNPEYIEIARRRLTKDAGMFAEVSA